MMCTTNSEEIDYTAYLEGSLVLTKQGEWVHEGIPFTNRKLSDYFHRSIQWNSAEHRYYLVVGRGRAEFTLEDTAYFIAEVYDSKSPWKARLLGGAIVAFQKNTLCFGEDNQLYCAVAGNHKARLTRAAFQHLMKYVVDDRHLRLDGELVRLQKREDLSFADDPKT